MAAEAKARIVRNCLLEEDPSFSDPAYTFTLKPGVVRYLTITDFLRLNVEELIALLRDLSPAPKIAIPYADYNCPGLDLEHADALLPNVTWDERLRVHQKFGILCKHHGAPSKAYHCFHTHLGLKNLKFDRFLESWVKKAWLRGDVTESYEGSSDHVVWECCSEGKCVFFKTPFVLGQLALVVAQEQRETKRLAEEAERDAGRLREEEEARRAAEDLDRLRKSGYRTFVYLMEDLRNGCFKIGHSKTPGKRERTLQSEVPSVALRFSVPAEEEHEKHLHAQFKHKNQRGEWFSLTADELLLVISFLKANGDTARASVDYEWLGRISFQAPSK